ncbi:MAG: GTPase HflX [Candidatus Acetothermia bacterium]|nr:GTPase HflX [Candidatus Acetothermia bacterium]MDH7505180.1 GTPase HflX [Candidatus Acetothermia bacterium]
MGRSGLVEDRLGERAYLRGGERAILVGLDLEDGHGDLAELALLSETAGVTVSGKVIQRRDRPDPSYFIGAGKVERLREQAALAGADTIIFDDSLSPAQSRNLEEQLERKIIDRPQLIMSIFAQHARTKEAKLQVELAQLEYLLPRLRGWGKVLTGLGGGIGTRGPGETKLEQERRRIKRRIQRIREELEKAALEREVKGKLRKGSGLPIVALIGYTNSGKSTLLNKLSGADAHVEDKLFATLDPLVRQATLPDNRAFLLVDTVGFIRKLPTQLIPAFLSTLEAVREADLLLNVLDISNREVFSHLATVQEVLADLFVDRPWPPLINVLNKADLLADPEGEERLARAMNEMRNAIPISALKGEGLDRLLARIGEELGPVRERLRLRIPYARAALLDELHRSGMVERAEYGPEGILVEVALAGEPLRQLERRAAADGLELERLPR